MMTIDIKEEIITGLNETTEDLLHAISAFDQIPFNTIPYEGSWTAGQVTEHVFKSESGIAELLSGNSKPASRPPDQNIEQIKTAFLDFTIKMKSPDFILPGNDEKNVEEFYEKIRSNRAIVIERAGTVDLTRVYDISIPGIGEMSGMEWLTFLVCHSKRHIHQLKKIYAALHT